MTRQGVSQSGNARQPDANGGADGPAWRIDRFELIYYNARHKRWQYFAEDPLIAFNDASNHRPGESPHRRQIRRFLCMVRETIETLTGTTSSFEIRTRTDLPNMSITIGRPTFDGWKPGWDAYVNYLSDTAKFGDGIADQDATTLTACWNSLKLAGVGSFDLTRQSALTLLSLLPIREDWDTWGCLLNARKAAIGENPSDCHFPPHCATADWFKPFYVAAIDYGARGHDGVSTEVLKKTVRLEAGCFDLAHPNHPWKVSPPADFFEYCKIPRSNESDDEKYIYLCYSHFVDSLITGLSGEVVNPDTYSDPQRVFFLAYPVVAAGRLHFVQMALTAKNPELSVQTLWDAWKPLHQHLWTAQTSTALEAEMERIALSAFQFAAGNDMRRKRQRGTPLNTPALWSVLAEHLYHLFPIRTFNQQKHWYYDPYVFDAKVGVGVPGCVLGYRWAPHEEEPTHFAGTAVENLIDFGIPGAFGGQIPRIGQNGLQDCLSRHRAVQSIEQQMDYLRDLQLTIDQETELEVADCQRASAVVADFVHAFTDEDLELLESATTAGDIEHLLNKTHPATLTAPLPITVPRSYSGAASAGILRRYLCQAYPTSPPDEYVNHLRRDARPTLLEDLSILLDTSLVKAYTHIGSVSRNFRGTLLQAQAAVRPGGFLYRCYERCRLRLQALELKADEDPISDLLEQAWLDCTAHLHSILDLNDIEAPREGRPTRRRLLSELRQGTLKEIYFPLIDPEGFWAFDVFLPWKYWLTPWLEEFKQQANKLHLAVTEDTVAITTHTTGRQSRFHHPGTSPVKHCHKYIWLPYCVKSGDFGPEAKIFEAWPAAARECAGLFLVSRDADKLVIREYRADRCPPVLDSVTDRVDSPRTVVAKSLLSGRRVPDGSVVPVQGDCWLGIEHRVWETVERHAEATEQC
jgi:hypothetical protein